MPPTSSRLAYLKNNGVWLEPVGVHGPAPAAPAVRLPGSENPERVFLSPTSGVALLFTTGKDGVRGTLVPPPYREARPLPPPFSQTRSVPEVVWSGDGRLAFCSVSKLVGTRVVPDLTGALRPETGRWHPLPFPLVHSASRDGGIVAWATEERVGVGWPELDRRWTLFSVRSPDPILQALRRARRPQRIRALANLDPDLYRDPANWQLGSPALAPDGKTVFFATNLGQGRSNNMTFAFFAGDVATGRLSVLSRLGTFEGSLPSGPDECRVCPHGDRLKFLTAWHNGDGDNPTGIYTVDLPTQALRHLRDPAPRREDDTNAVDGVAWSPDSRLVAASVVYYGRSHALDNPDWEPPPGAYTLLLFDAATGRILRRIAGARRPAWSR